MKPVAIVAIGFLVFVAATHLVRLVMRWKVVINGREMPRWFSALACAFVAGLALLLWWETFLK